MNNKPDDFLNYFSEKEKEKVYALADFRTKLVKPLVVLLDKLKFTPNILSLFGLLVLTGFFYFMTKDQVFIASLYLLGHILFDGLDGPLARYKKISSNAGALTDMAVDHSVMLVVAFTLLYVGYASSLWLSFYMVFYTIMIGFVIILNKMKHSPKVIIRTKYFLFFIPVFEMLFGFSIMNMFLIIFSVYMFFNSIYLFYKLRCLL